MRQSLWATTRGVIHIFLLVFVCLYAYVRSGALLCSSAFVCMCAHECTKRIHAHINTHINSHINARDDGLVQSPRVGSPSWSLLSFLSFELLLTA